MIILLDLNYTLVENSEEKNRDMLEQIAGERYRQWLIDLVQPHTVILITARPAKYHAATMQSISDKTGWKPAEAYFNAFNLPPPLCKDRILNGFVFPKHGKDGAKYFGIESNPKTRAMYLGYRIRSCAQNDNSLRQFLNGK
jgi:hypothetical protein